MSDEILVRHCAPTLAGLKTANMFNCEYDSEKEMREDLRELNRRLSSKGVMAVPLKYNGKTCLVYIVRIRNLEADLLDDTTLRILKDQGYSDLRPGCLIARLSRRLSGDDYPHEIGLFLGYPPEDVKGFIEKRECKLSGYWRVYSDVSSAKAKFDKFSKCFRIYLEQLEKGRALEQLTVGFAG